MMKILTVENKVYEINSIPNEIDDIRYCVFDAGDPTYMDYYFLPLIFLESFHSPAICLTIGNFKIQMPMDWSIVTSDSEFSGLDVTPLASPSLNRGSIVPLFNPLHNCIPQPAELHITNIYQDVKWYFPKLKNGHVLVVPLEDGPNPKCALFVKETTKVKDIDFADLL